MCFKSTDLVSQNIQRTSLEKKSSILSLVGTLLVVLWEIILAVSSSWFGNLSIILITLD